MSIKVSIITIVLNQSKTLKKTIDSVKNQNYDNIEYIIIDGGSTDGTIEVIKENNKYISHWISEKDKGISDAFNKGLKFCTGELIGIINADDWYEKDAIRNVVSQMKSGDVFYGNMQYWKKNTKTHLAHANHTFLNKEMTINHPTVFVKKKVYDLLGNFDLTYSCAMDYELLLRFYTNKVKFVYIKKTITHMQGDGISDINWLLGCREVKRAKDKYLGKKLFNWIWLQKQALTILSFRFLEKIGLNMIVQFYRNNFATIKKEVV